MPDFSVYDDKGASKGWSMPGEPSARDINNSLISSLSGPVGPAQDFGNKKSDDQKTAEEQLKTQEALKEGLEELVTLVKDIKKLAAEKTATPSSKKGDFGNVTDALSQMTGSGGDKTRKKFIDEIEKSDVFSQVAEFAKAALTPHSTRLVEVGGVLDRIESRFEQVLALIQSGGGPEGPGRRIFATPGFLQRREGEVGDIYRHQMKKLAEAGSPGATELSIDPRAISPTVRPFYPSMAPSPAPPRAGMPAPTPMSPAAGGPGGMPAPAPMSPAAGGPGGMPVGLGIPKTVEELALQKEFKDESAKIDKVYAKILDKSAKYAGKLKVQEKTLQAILGLMQSEGSESVELLNYLKLALDGFGQMEKSQRIFFQLQIKQIENLYKAGASTEEIADSVRRLVVGLQQVGKTFDENRLQRFSTALQKIKALLDIISPASMGMTPEINLDPKARIKAAVDQIKEITKMTYAASGITGDITTQTGTWRKQLLDVSMHMNEIAMDAGVTQEIWTKQILKGMQRGIMSSIRLNNLTRTGTVLARSIGANAETTTDELTDWAQRFNQSNLAAAALANNIRMVGRATGLTGDNLLKAVQSAKEVALQMRSAGTYTEEANRQVMMMSASAGRLGTQRLVQPMMSALSSPMTAIQSGMMPMFAQAGIWGEIQQGRGNDAGTQAKLLSYFEQLQNELKGMPIIVQQARLQAISGGKFQGIGDLIDAIRTMKEAQPPEVRRQQLETKMSDKNEIMSKNERDQLQQEIDRLKKAEEGQAQGKAFSEIVDALKKGQAPEQISGLKEKLETLTQGMGTGQEKIAEAMRDPVVLRELLEKSRDSMEKATADASQKQQNTFTAAEQKTHALLAQIQQAVNDFSTKVMSKIPPDMLVGIELSRSILGEIIKLISTVGTIVVALQGLSFLKSLIPGVGGGGLPGMTGTMGGAAGVAGARGFFSTAGAGRAIGTAGAGLAAAYVVREYGATKVEEEIQNYSKQISQMNAVVEKTKQATDEYAKNVQNLSDEELAKKLKELDSAIGTTNQAMNDATRQLTTGVWAKTELFAKEFTSTGAADRIAGQFGQAGNAMAAQQQELFRQKRATYEEMFKRQSRGKTYEEITSQVPDLEKKIKDIEIQKDAIRERFGAAIPRGEGSTMKQLKANKGQIAEMLGISLQEVADILEKHTHWNGDDPELAVKEFSRMLKDSSGFADLHRQQTEYENALARSTEVLEKSQGVYKKMFIDQAAGKVSKADQPLLESYVQKFIEMRQAKGKGWNAALDPEVQRMNKLLGISLVDMEQKSTTLFDNLSKQSAIKSKMEGDELKLRQYLKPQWKDKEGNLDELANRDFQSHMLEFTGNKYKDYAEFTEKATAEEIKAALDRYSKMDYVEGTKRGYKFTDPKTTTDAIIESQKKLAESNMALKNAILNMNIRDFISKSAYGDLSGEKQYYMRKELEWQAGKGLIDLSDTNAVNAALQNMANRPSTISEQGLQYLKTGNQGWKDYYSVEIGSYLKEQLKEGGALSGTNLTSDQIADISKKIIDKAIKGEIDIRDKEKVDEAMKQMAKDATREGSIFTHDTHLEKILDDIAETLDSLDMYIVKPLQDTLEAGNALLTSAPVEYANALADVVTTEPEVTSMPEDNDAYIRRRIETEFAGTEASESIVMANNYLKQLADDNRQQLEIMKQQLQALQDILEEVENDDSTIGPGDTSSNITPQSPPNYYAWAIRSQNLPNFGGIDNYVRG